MTVLFVVGFGLSAYVIQSFFRLHSPTGVFALATLAAIGVNLTAPGGLAVLGLRAGLLVATASLLVVATSAVAQSGSVLPASPLALALGPTYERRLRRLLLALLLGSGAGLVLVAVAVQATVGLDAVVNGRRQLRYEQSYGALQHLGLAGLLLELVPLLAVFSTLAVLTSTSRVLAAAGFTLATLASFATPSRTFGSVCLLWSLLLVVHLRPPRRIRLFQLLLLTAGALALLLLFIQSGRSLGKVESTKGSAATEVRVYTVGGLSALQVAMETDAHPVDGFGRSIRVLIRATRLIDPTVRLPNSVASFVDTPRPINVYSWVGDVYFDFGVLGVLVAAILLGFVSAWVFRLANTKGSTACLVASAWLSTSMLQSLGQATWGTESFWLLLVPALVAGRYLDRSGECPAVASPSDGALRA